MRDDINDTTLHLLLPNGQGGIIEIDAGMFRKERTVERCCTMRCCHVGVISRSTWHHALFVYDGAVSTATMYIDGKFAVSARKISHNSHHRRTVLAVALYRNVTACMTFVCTPSTTCLPLLPVHGLCRRSDSVIRTRKRHKFRSDGNGCTEAAQRPNTSSLWSVCKGHTVCGKK